MLQSAGRRDCRTVAQRQAAGGGLYYCISGVRLLAATAAVPYGGGPSQWGFPQSPVLNDSGRPGLLQSDADDGSMAAAHCTAQHSPPAAVTIACTTLASTAHGSSRSIIASLTALTSRDLHSHPLPLLSMMSRVELVLTVVLALLVAFSCCSLAAGLSSAAGELVSFGSGYSQYTLTAAETPFFNHSLSSSASYGVLTHFWITGGASALIDTSIWSYYIDGESSPSIQFTPAMAAGVGFADPTAPWGNRWMGKGAADGGWYNNLSAARSTGSRQHCVAPAVPAAASHCRAVGAAATVAAAVPFPSTSRSASRAGWRMPAPRPVCTSSSEAPRICPSP